MSISVPVSTAEQHVDRRPREYLRPMYLQIVHQEVAQSEEWLWAPAPNGARA